jgi:hypothetical protein
MASERSSHARAPARSPLSEQHAAQGVDGGCDVGTVLSPRRAPGVADPPRIDESQGVMLPGGFARSSADSGRGHARRKRRFQVGDPACRDRRRGGDLLKDP